MDVAQAARSINLWNLAVDVAELLICGMSIVQIVTVGKLDRTARHYFLWFYICTIFFVGGNLAGQLLYGKTGWIFRVGMYAANYCEFLFSAALAYIGARYLLALADPDRRLRLPRILTTVFFGLHFVLLNVSQFTDLLYRIDSHNRYFREEHFYLALLGPILILLCCLVLLIVLRSRFTRRERIAFCFYLLVPLAAVVAQPFINYYVIIQAMLIALLTMYVFILSDQTERYYRQEREAEQLKINLMMSQIQPHFLYNSLGTIQALCRSDPKLAERAVGDFAQFLRHNMRSIESDQPILFRQELNHTQNYLALQKLRFGDDLNIVYDLECENFSLPTLTLQPLVENAVSHGIRQTESGRGTVTIRTREMEDHYELSVIDDGVGFDPTARTYTGKGAHIALTNIRSRLARVIGGSLRIISAPGMGTTATILIPKAVSHSKPGSG